MKSPSDPSYHPDAANFEKVPDAILHHLAIKVRTAVLGGADAESLAAWEAVVDETIAHVLADAAPPAVDARTRARFAPATPTRAEILSRRAAAREISLDMARALRLFRGQTLDAIGKAPKVQQRAQLRALFDNYVMHQTEMHGEVPASALTVPDWEAARGLAIATSEPSLLRLEKALERGQFIDGPHGYPAADISGRVGMDQVQGFAELRDGEIDSEEARRVMRDLALRLSNPALGLGPKVQQTVQALMSFWLTRRGADNYVRVTLDHLAGQLGYTRGANGFKARDYDSVREFVSIAATINLEAVAPANSKTGLGRVQEKAFAFTYFDDAGTNARASKGWLAIAFRPNTLYTAAAGRDKAFLKGYDPKLNALNPVNERPELLLGKYLENAWRMNWDTAPGVVVRKVRTLLVEGSGIAGEDVEARPSIKAAHKLEDALDKLQERGTVRAWEAGEGWADVMEALQPKERRQPRMTARLWARILEVPVTIEAGGAYHAHMKGHRLTQQAPDDLEALTALREYVATNEQRSRASIARDLGISGPLLSLLLSGRRSITPRVRESIDRLVNQGKTLSLPFPTDGKR